MIDIGPKTSVEEILEICPESMEVFSSLGLQVYVCSQPVWDSLEQLCEKNGKNLKELIEKLKAKCA